MLTLVPIIDPGLQKKCSHVAIGLNREDVLSTFTTSGNFIAAADDLLRSLTPALTLITEIKIGTSAIRHLIAGRCFAGIVAIDGAAGQRGVVGYAIVRERQVV